MTKNLIKSLSLVIPCNNEQDAIKISLKIYMDILKDLLNNKIISSFEVVVVNNGSTDKTLEVLKEQKDNYNIKIVNLKKNYGYTSSYLAGMYHTKNEMIIIINCNPFGSPASPKPTGGQESRRVGRTKSTGRRKGKVGANRRVGG